MKRVILLSWLVFYCTLSAISQTQSTQSFTEKYNKEAIYLSVGWHYYFNKDGTSKRVGIFGKHLEPEMTISPEATTEFRVFQKNRKTSIWLLLAAATMYTSGAIIGLENGDTLGQGLFLGGVGVGMISIPFSIKANKSLSKSVWIRNRDVLK